MHLGGLRSAAGTSWSNIAGRLPLCSSKPVCLVCLHLHHPALLCPLIHICFFPGGPPLVLEISARKKRTACYFQPPAEGSTTSLPISSKFIWISVLCLAPCVSRISASVVLLFLCHGLFLPLVLSSYVAPSNLPLQIAVSDQPSQAM